MIEQFEAVSYKGLQNFCVEPLQRVNLITGPNGVGKTSLAEALWLFHGRYNPSLLWNLHVQRTAGGRASPLLGLGGRPVELRGREHGEVDGVKFEYAETVDTSPGGGNAVQRPASVEITGTLGSGMANVTMSGFGGLSPFPILGKLRATYGSGPNDDVYESEVVLGPAGPGLARALPQRSRPSGIIVTRDLPFPLAPEAIERFSNVVSRGEKLQLLDSLRLMRPPIKDIQILIHQGVPSLWAETDEAELLPVEAVGGGVVRLLGLLVNFFTVKGGLIVIDEIENGIHHSALPELWRQVRQLSKLLDVQVVATTHSFECIQAAVMNEDGSTSPPPDFVLLRMYQKGGVPHCLTYAGEKLGAALDMGFEIR